MIKKIIQLIKLIDDIYYRDTHLWEYVNWNKTQDMKKEVKEILNSFILVKIVKSI